MSDKNKLLVETLGVEKLEYGLLEYLDLQLGLEDFIKEKNIDLVAMTSRQYNLISRFYIPIVTHNSFSRPISPLLVFHAL